MFASWEMPLYWPKIQGHWWPCYSTSRSLRIQNSTKNKESHLIIMHNNYSYWCWLNIWKRNVTTEVCTYSIKNRSSFCMLIMSRDSLPQKHLLITTLWCHRNQCSAEGSVDEPILKWSISVFSIIKNAHQVFGTVVWLLSVTWN